MTRKLNNNVITHKACFAVQNFTACIPWNDAMRALFAHINVSLMTNMMHHGCLGNNSGKLWKYIIYHRNFEKANEIIPNNAKRRHKSVWELCSQLCQVRNNINMIKLCFKNVDFACWLDIESNEEILYPNSTRKPLK